ncbi:8787_t:CDS:2 [Scutellospora calospora]|uniref:8787_t:CDS:1 n=1 Tax=Scutellospora calospora TaxID=85575 RepID=A0ACA9JYH0_9GLOM|nr:8787_t:CDS:2 [Scutellospora calospora]
MMITRRIFLYLFLISILLVIPTFIGATKYDRNDPTTWTPQELKEWLSEHRIDYKVIPDKQELVKLVKNHFKCEEPKTTDEAIKDFVNYYFDSLKEVNYEIKDSTPEKLNEYTQKVANQIEQLRQITYLTEEQINSVFDKIFERLKGTKDFTNKNLEKALYQIRDSYALAKERRDAIIHNTSSRIEKDISTSKEISQNTVDLFKEEINKLSESGAFAKSRLGTQISLILHGIQERLTQNKISTADQINAAYDKLSTSVEDSYRSIDGTLERIRKELANSIGVTAESFIEEVKNQLSTVNDYRLLTQEKIQIILDNIGQKFQDGKTLTVEQLQFIKDTIKSGFGTIKYYYSSTTGHAKQAVDETTKKAREEHINRIIKDIQDRIQELKKKGDETQLSLHEIENDITIQQLNPGQARILSEVIKQQFENLKDAKDLTEDKVSAFLGALKVKLAETTEYVGDKLAETTEYVGDKISEGYDTTSEQLSEGYNVAKNKVSEGYEKSSEKIGEGFDKVKGHLNREKDEL